MRPFRFAFVAIAIAFLFSAGAAQAGVIRVTGKVLRGAGKGTAAVAKHAGPVVKKIVY